MHFTANSNFSKILYHKIRIGTFETITAQEIVDATFTVHLYRKIKQFRIPKESLMHQNLIKLQISGHNFFSYYLKADHC